MLLFKNFYLWITTKLFGVKTKATIVHLELLDSWKYSKIGALGYPGAQDRSIEIQYRVDGQLYQCTKEVSTNIMDVKKLVNNNEITIRYHKNNPEYIILSLHNS